MLTMMLQSVALKVNFKNVLLFCGIQGLSTYILHNIVYT